MRLSTFIRQNEENILQQWEDFAATLQGERQQMNTKALRDHARLMLQAFAENMEQPQSRVQQLNKSRGLSPRGRKESAAQAHGGDRMEWGFSITEMVSEFRALRAVVTRLWNDAHPNIGGDDLVRFNEAIDQALAESVSSFTSEKRQQERLLGTMLSYSPDHNYIFDLDGRFLYANHSAAALFDRQPAEVCFQIVDEIDRAFADEVHRQTARVLESGVESRGETTLCKGTGNEIVIEYLFVPIFNDDGGIEAIAGNSRNITERKSMERKLWRHANYDALTEIPNRRLFADRLAHEIRHARRSGNSMALLYIDLDKFKEANDYLGHDGGDSLLRQAAQRIESCIRESDLLARMGGDEFTVVLLDIAGSEQVEAIARKMLLELAAPFSIGREAVRISGSIGVALFPDDAETEEALIANADHAMYSAKNAGGNHASFYVPSDTAAWARNIHVHRQH